MGVISFGFRTKIKEEGLIMFGCGLRFIRESREAKPAAPRKPRKIIEGRNYRYFLLFCCYSHGTLFADPSAISKWMRPLLELL